MNFPFDIAHPILCISIGKGVAGDMAKDGHSTMN